MAMMSIFSIPDRWKRDWRRLVANYKHEWDDDGDLLIAGASFKNYQEHYAPDGQGWIRTPNTMMTAGRNHALDVLLHGTTAFGTWYIAPFSANITPDAATLYTGFAGTATELTTQYSESTRVAYVESAAAAGSTNNNASPATVTAAEDSVLIYGAGLVSFATKGDTAQSGAVLLAMAKYSSPGRTLATTGDTFGIKWVINL